MQLGHSRGRPHKQLTPVDYSDFPHNALKKEQEKWQKRNNMEKWRYAKKTGPDSHKFRQAESSLWTIITKLRPRKDRPARPVRAMQVRSL